MTPEEITEKPADVLVRAADLLNELLGRDSIVAKVPPIADDTATGHRKRDAEWIAAMNPTVGGHLVTILRGTAELSAQTGLVGAPLLALAYAVLGEDPAAHLRVEETTPNV